MRALTERQEKFAMEVGGHGKTQSDAYRMFYKCDGWTGQAIAEAASRVANSSNVSARIMEIQKRKQDAANINLDMTVKKLLETYIAIAFVDPNELISLRKGACRHCHGLDFGYQWKEREFLKACDDAESARHPLPLPDIAGGFGYMRTREPNPECPECEGEGVERVVPRDTTKLSPGAKMLYQGVHQTNTGLKILFADKNKALDQIGRIIGAYDDKLRVDLQGKVAGLMLTTNDPAEAAAAYQRMLTGG